MDGRKLTKVEIIDAVWQKAGLDKQEIRCCYDEIISVIKEALSGERTVELRGFGTFEVRRRKGRTRARNPRTGELVASRPHGICAFKPGRELKLAVWNLEESAPPAEDTAPPPRG